MDNKTIQINSIKRAIGQLEMQLGMKTIWDGISDFSDTEGDYARFCKPLLALPVTQLDDKYYFTSWDNWQKIIDTINPIVLSKPWMSNRADCDKRAMFVTALVSMLFEINTCRMMYCSVYRVSDGKWAYDHYANVISTLDGTAILWDLDEGGLTTKITTLTPVINNKKYVLKAVK